jgi:hypothetical protein
MYSQEVNEERNGNRPETDSEDWFVVGSTRRSSLDEQRAALYMKCRVDKSQRQT